MSFRRVASCLAFMFVVLIASTMLLAADPPAKDGWWVRVCKEKMKTDHIDFSIGPDSGTNYLYKWTNTSPNEFDVRQDYRNLQDLWVNGDGEHGKAKYFCLMYKSNVVKHYDFDNGESHSNSQGDHDNECACSQ